MNTRIENVLSVVLTIAAVAMTIVVVKREFFDESAATKSAKPSFLKGWELAYSAGSETSTATARVKIVEFLDLQCPACRYYHRVELSDFKARVDSTLYSFIVEPMPLQIHSQARIAARAAECAGEQHRFAKFVDVAFAQQENFGVRPWVSYATESGIADSGAFAVCMGSDRSSAVVEAGADVGEQLGIHATPTFVVNGWEFPSPPLGKRLAEVVTEFADGKLPFGKAPK